MRKPIACFTAGLLLVGNLIAQPKPSGPQQAGDFRKVILESDIKQNDKFIDSLQDPMELVVGPDGTVFYAQRNGIVRMVPPGEPGIEIAKVPTFTGLEDGMLGITLDPNFAKNKWIYLNRSLPETTKDANGKKQGVIRVSRFTLKSDKLDMASEKAIIDITTQREQCCHVGGSLAFDPKGNLVIAVGDNTNPFHDGSQPKPRNGYSPIDERKDRSPWDAQKSSANANDLRGAILRVKPKADGGYTIPEGNLFKPGTKGTRPEIFAMGTRNSYRLGVDQKTGYIYWGDVGPDARLPNPNYGPAGFDEVNQARQAGFFGWPYFVGTNKPYREYDYAADKAAPAYDAKKPINNSPNNTGIKELPPAEPAFIAYPHSFSAHFPAVNPRPGEPGGRTAMAGPVYYFDAKLKSAHKLPKQFDRTLFIYEWSRNWIIAVKLDADHNIEKMERFADGLTFKRPMDLELGPDGCLYAIEWGTGWGKNVDTQIVRIEYTGKQ